MEIKEAIKILDDVIPPPNHPNVDWGHLPIANAWVSVKAALGELRGCEENDKPTHYCPNCGANMRGKEE